MIPNHEELPDLHPPSSRRRGIMLAQPLWEKRLKKWGTSYVLGDPKLEGERGRALLTPEGVKFFSSEMNQIVSVPHLNRSLSQLKIPEGHYLELDGELYNHDMTINEIESIVSCSVNLHPNHEAMEFHIFDIVIPKESQLNRSLKLAELGTNIKELSGIKIVPRRPIENSITSIMDFVQEMIDLGYEGGIFRHPQAFYERKRSLWIMKFKPRKRDTYKIVGYTQEVDKLGNPREAIGALWFEGSEMNPERFKVGTGMSDDLKHFLWTVRDQLAGNYIDINYQALTNRGVPYAASFPNSAFAELLTMFDVRTKED